MKIRFGPIKLWDPPPEDLNLIPRVVLRHYAVNLYGPSGPLNSTFSSYQIGTCTPYGPGQAWDLVKLIYSMGSPVCLHLLFTCLSHSFLFFLPPFRKERETFTPCAGRSFHLGNVPVSRWMGRSANSQF